MWARIKRFSGHESPIDVFFLLGASLIPLWLIIGRAMADISISVIAGSFLLLSLYRKQWKWMAKPDMRILFIVWLVIVSCSFWLALTPKTPWYALGFIRFILLYGAIRYWLYTTTNALRAAALMGVVILTLVLLDTYVQYISGISLTGFPKVGEHYRLSGPLNHPNIGNYLFKLSMPLLALFLLWRSEKTQQRYLTWGLSIWSAALFALILISGERSITVQLFVALGMFIGLTWCKLPHLRNRLYAGVLLGISILTVLAVTQLVIQLRAMEFVQLLSHFSQTVYGQLFGAAVYLGLENPLTGVGVLQFKLRCPELLAQSRVSYCDIHPHNTYLQWFVETGLLGLCLFLAFLAVIVYQAYRCLMEAGKPQVLPLIAAFSILLAFLFPFVVTQSVFSNWSAALYWYSLAYLMAVIQQPGEAKR